MLESEINILPSQLFCPCSILDQNKSYFIILVATVIFAKHSAALRTYFRQQPAANMVVSLLLGLILTLYPRAKRVMDIHIEEI